MFSSLTHKLAGQAWLPLWPYYCSLQSLCPSCCWQITTWSLFFPRIPVASRDLRSVRTSPMGMPGLQTTAPVSSLKLVPPHQHISHCFAKCHVAWALLWDSQLVHFPALHRIFCLAYSLLWVFWFLLLPSAMVILAFLLHIVWAIPPSKFPGTNQEAH